MGMTGLGGSFKAKPLNCDPRNAGVLSVNGDDVNLGQINDP